MKPRVWTAAEIEAVARDVWPAIPAHNIWVAPSRKWMCVAGERLSLGQTRLCPAESAPVADWMGFLGQAGSRRRTTLRRIRAELDAAGRDPLLVPVPQRYAVNVGAEGDCSALRYAVMARPEECRRKNWGEPSRCVWGNAPGLASYTVNHGRYSSRCKYTHYTYGVTITHTLRAAGRVLVGAIPTADGGSARLSRVLPAGWTWGHDAQGLRAVGAGGIDYHPTLADIRDHARGTWYSAQARALAAKRRAAERERRAAERAQTQEGRAMRRIGPGDVWVCLADSIRAGNCMAGSVRFATAHSLDTRRHVLGAVLLRLATSAPERVQAVVEQARRREAKEFVRGYAVLAEHVA